MNRIILLLSILLAQTGYGASPPPPPEDYPVTYHTPNYPAHYPNNVYESTYISLGSQPAGAYLIQINGASERNYDFLYLRQNGENICDPIHGDLGFEGMTVWVDNPFPVEVIFSSDYSITRQGFLVEAVPVPGDSSPTIYETPNYPSPYNPNESDAAYLAPPPGELDGDGRLLKIFGKSQAYKDILRIFDSTQEVCPSIHGDLGPQGLLVDLPQVAKSMHLRVTFESDDSVQYGGFRVESHVYPIKPLVVYNAGTSNIYFYNWDTDEFEFLTAVDDPATQRIKALTGGWIDLNGQAHGLWRLDDDGRIYEYKENKWTEHSTDYSECSIENISRGHVRNSPPVVNIMGDS